MRGPRRRNIEGDEKENELFELCASPNVTVEAIQTLLNNKADPNLPNEYHLDLPIHRITNNQNFSLELLKCLVEAKSDLNYGNSFGESLLHHLFNNRRLQPEVLGYVLEMKADSNILNEEGLSPLHYLFCAQNVPLDVVKILVEAKANLNVKDYTDYLTPLRQGCRKSTISFEIIKHLVEEKADINIDRRGEISVLNDVCENENYSLEVVKYLVEQKADVTNSLPSACKRSGSLELVKYLIDQKADINSYLPEDGTSLFNVSLNKKDGLEVAKYIIEDCKMDLFNGPLFENSTEVHVPLYHACERSNNFELVKYFMGLKMDINHIGYNETTSFMLACENEHLSLEDIKYLVENKADVLYHTGDKTNALYSLSHNKNATVEKVKYLVECKLDPLQSTLIDNTSALHSFCLYNNNLDVEVVKYFVEAKADLTQCARFGRHQTTPIDICMMNVNMPFEVIKYLVDCKSDVTNIFGFSMGRVKISFESVKYLVENKADINKGDVIGSMCTTDSCSLEMVKYLVENNANIHFVDRSSCLAKICANSDAPLEAVKYLIDSKADVNFLNQNSYNSFERLFNRKTPISPKEAEMMFIHFLFAGFNQKIYTQHIPRSFGIRELIERHKNQALWSTESHQLFPVWFRKRVVVLMLCLRALSKKSKQIFPKPILGVVNGKWAELELKQIEANKQSSSEPIQQTSTRRPNTRRRN